LKIAPLVLSADFKEEVIVSGSGIFRTGDYAQTIHRMRNAVG
jgi:pentose-5-phosphate-3-epimerase